MTFDGDVISVEYYDSYLVAWLEPTSWRGRIGYCVGYDEADEDPKLAEEMARAKLIRRNEDFLERPYIPLSQR